jgi:hypothetical protein
VRIKGSACGPLMRYPCFPKSTFFASLFTWYTVLSRMPAWQQRQGQGNEIGDTSASMRVASCSNLWQECVILANTKSRTHTNIGRNRTSACRQPRSHTAKAAGKGTHPPP